MKTSTTKYASAACGSLRAITCALAGWRRQTICWSPSSSSTGTPPPTSPLPLTMANGAHEMANTPRGAKKEKDCIHASRCRMGKARARANAWGTVVLRANQRKACLAAWPAQMRWSEPEPERERENCTERNFVPLLMFARIVKLAHTM